VRVRIILLTLMLLLLVATYPFPVRAVLTIQSSEDRVILENSLLRVELDLLEGAKPVSFIVKPLGYDIITRDRYPSEWLTQEPWPGSIYRAPFIYRPGETTGVAVSCVLTTILNRTGVNVTKVITLYADRPYFDIEYILTAIDRPVSVASTWDPNLGFAVEWACMYGSATDDDRQAFGIGDRIELVKKSWCREYGPAWFVALYDNDTGTDPETGVSGLMVDTQYVDQVYSVWFEYSVATNQMWTCIRLEFKAVTLMPGHPVHYVVRYFACPIDRTLMESIGLEKLYEKIPVGGAQRGITPEQVAFYGMLTGGIVLLAASAVLAVRRYKAGERTPPPKPPTL